MHVVFRRSQKMHTALRKIEDLKSKSRDKTVDVVIKDLNFDQLQEEFEYTDHETEAQFFQLIKSFPASFSWSEIHQNAITHHRTKLTKIITAHITLPSEITDIIFLYCYSTEEDILSYSIAKYEIIEIMKSRFETCSNWIVCYCLLRLVFIIASFIVLLYE